MIRRNGLTESPVNILHEVSQLLDEEVILVIRGWRLEIRKNNFGRA